MTQFREGQEVEVAYADETWSGWRKALIINADTRLHLYSVRFPDGKRGVFNEEHIRAARRDLAKQISTLGQDSLLPNWKQGK